MNKEEMIQLYEVLNANQNQAAVMILDLLRTECEECNGDGVIDNPEWVKFLEQHPDYDPESCEDDPPEGSEELECKACKGLGMVPTAIGKAILHFVRTYLDE